MASSDCETACCGVPKDSPPVWQYVGEGRGNFERVEQYAPRPNGSYILQAAPKPRPIWMILTILFGVTFCILLVVLMVLLLRPRGQETTTTTTEPPKKTGGGECQAGLSDYKNLWPAVTMNECCTTKGVGCSSCDVQLSASWTYQEKDYCCFYRQLGCTAPCQTPRSTVGYSDVAEHSLFKAQFRVHAGCAPGYSGTAVANECATNGEAYTLSGCAPQGFTAKVVMGSSLRDATKCVLPHEPVVCDSRAAQHQRDDKWPDRFDVFEDPKNPYQVCARRTDIEHGWGLPLVLHCQPKYSGTNGPIYEQIAIGPSTSATKCVTPRVPVKCDATAGHHGRLDTKSDTFKIVHQGDKICATRTDVDSHWGLDLVVLCHKDEHFQEVVVGSSLLSTKKCVTPDLAVKCRPHASVSVDQQKQNAGYPDQFVVSMENGQICAQRKDSKNIWGVNLVLKCEKAHDGITAVRAES